MGKHWTSLVSPVGRNNHECGYCHSDNDTSYTYGLWTHSLACADYQAFIDRGWRRSGKYLYKPDLNKSCCPQYTIRLDASKFKVSKSQRKVLSKFNRFIEGTWEPHAEDHPMKERKPSHPSRVNPDSNKSLSENIHIVEDKDGFKHKLQIVLEPSSYTDEKFELFRAYQVHVHKDEYSEVSSKSFKRFLVDTPLQRESVSGIDQSVAGAYGSFHQKYILDGRLIAMAVLDILPKCVSSVYFMYHPDYGFLGLGKYSALREIGLAQELNQTSSDLHWYYMGYYIHSCPKMNYKGSYQPSDLLDPETYKWYPIDDCKKWLDKKKFVCFSKPDEGYQYDDDRIPGTLDINQVTPMDATKVRVKISDDEAVPVTALVGWYSSEDFQALILEYIAIVGRDMIPRLVVT
ncbi:hypothetical protein LRAMOSA08443 [Lichtheimia ramosa]|uniref:Arginyl-tRNA--protein transferase 1 n=1 Tax=Lichtheimia ramosa TaxID=688394 RepID=A0A077WER4_9FUNG|nr:hypothetical protein LRAMOSA08443 [Lichtheimia ramosa]